MNESKFSCSAAVLLMTTLLVAGCSNEPAANSRQENDVVAVGSNDHSGWWCVEHAIPESECSMCNAKVAATAREKGDWCEEHQRARSQCFVCDPTLAEKYARLYEAKFGTAPPPPNE
jgi:cobalt-zinc-cadmium efflux system membrane fusion protein